MTTWLVTTYSNDSVSSWAVFLFYSLFLCLFKENKVDGKILATFSRADLTDLFPADFITRKKLWDFICNMVSVYSLWILHTINFMKESEQRLNTFMVMSILMFNPWSKNTI